MDNVMVQVSLLVVVVRLLQLMGHKCEHAVLVLWVMHVLVLVMCWC